MADRLGAPCSGIIAAAAQLGSTGVLEDAHKLARTAGDRAYVLAMATLRAAGGHHAGFGELAINCAERIRALLARPQRAPGGWSIELPTGCACDLCEALGTFLQHPERRALDWPLAKDKRRHVHARINDAELPVRHETRRQGRPYTLVLTKTEALFERERLARERHEANLAWLTDTGRAHRGGGGSSRRPRRPRGPEPLDLGLATSPAQRRADAVRLRGGRCRNSMPGGIVVAGVLD
ncbi:hypothetical protein [Nonomuraea sp. NPDC049784]|uniref:hypothetical protein n=1 Tax=Nonomuraea sp. NPDC049784 TaxID=3154361 RepID=UPI0033E3C417